jgi:hypothetical protein
MAPGHAPAQKGLIVKIVVIGGSGLIGSKLVTKLRERGHETLAASPKSDVNTLTGEGLATALEGASVVVDVSNSPSFEDAAVLEFFETSTRNLVAAEAAAGVGHHVALSVVGTERLLQSGYFRATGRAGPRPESNTYPVASTASETFTHVQPGDNMSTPTGGNAFLHELELTVRTELTLAETSQRLLGAVEALEDGLAPGHPSPAEVP